MAVVRLAKMPAGEVDWLALTDSLVVMVQTSLYLVAQGFRAVVAVRLV